MTKVATIPLGEWLPSAPTFENPGCEVADNCIPTTRGYGPIRSLDDTGDNTTEQVYGAQQFYDSNQDSVIVAGSDTRLIKRTSSALTETTGLSSIGTGEAWDFAQFNNFLFATANGNSPQYLANINTDTTFASVPGSPPSAKRCAKVGEFLVLGNISGAPNRIQWSSYNNPAGSWAVDRLTQSGFADLDTAGGAVQRIIGGRYALIFLERAILRMVYVGPPSVWSLPEVTTDRGTTAPFSVVNVGFLTYFLAQDGFYVTNGSQVEPIGTQRVNSWFFENVNQAFISEVHGAVDWQNECIFWVFRSTGDGYDRALIYSWAQQRWSSGTFQTGWLVGANKDAVDIDSLDAIYGNIDAIPYSLDDPRFLAGERRLAMFDVDRNYQTFSGTPLEATWETGAFQPSPGQRVMASEARPIMEANSWDARMTLYMWDNMGMFSASAERPTGFAGFSPIRGEGNRIGVRMRKPGGTDWSEAQSVQVRYQEAGFR
ncbi:MAG: hypothetical protein AAFR21_11615 [Pseudomonadota bacterium]